MKVAQLCPTLCDPSPWNSPGQNTGVGSLSILQGIFSTQELNPGLLHCSQILYQLSHKGNPRILEWVAYPFSSVSSWPRNQTGISCIAGRFFTNWATGTPLERKAMTNLDSVLKSRDITLLTKFYQVKGMVFLVVMYRCENWTIKKAEYQRIDAFWSRCWKRLLRLPLDSKEMKPVSS